MTASRFEDVLKQFAKAGDRGAREYPLMCSLGMSREEHDPTVKALQESHQIAVCSDPMDSKARILKNTAVDRAEGRRLGPPSA